MTLTTLPAFVVLAISVALLLSYPFSMIKVQIQPQSGIMVKVEMMSKLKKNEPMYAGVAKEAKHISSANIIMPIKVMP
jgi:hypothetical protein